MPAVSKLAARAALPLPLFERSNSCAMLSPAITAMRSVPLIFAESRISRIRRSTNCTACSNSSRSDSRQATRYSRPRMETSSVIEGSSTDSARRFRQLLQQRVESRGRGGDARIQRTVLLQRAAELALQGFVFGAQPMIVRKQRGEFLLESGNFGVHGNLGRTIGGTIPRRQPRRLELMIRNTSWLRAAHIGLQVSPALRCRRASSALRCRLRAP